MTTPLAEVHFRITRPRTFATWVYDRLFDWRMDRIFGIQTSRRRHRGELGYPDTNHVHYQPVSYLDFPGLVANAPAGPGEVFLEVGCGMGRAVCLAAMLPFSKVIGVELSRDLAEIAERNVERVRSKIKCNDVVILVHDACTLPISSEVTVVFLFNPIRGPLLTKFLKNLEHSTAMAPRRVTVLACASPVDAEFYEPFWTATWLRTVRKVILPTGCVCVVFETS